jgi:hypothetical protein
MISCVEECSEVSEEKGEDDSLSNGFEIMTGFDFEAAIVFPEID